MDIVRGIFEQRQIVRGLDGKHERFGGFVKRAHMIDIEVGERTK
jgi:hypothetical protein